MPSRAGRAQLSLAQGMGVAALPPSSWAWPALVWVPMSFSFSSHWHEGVPQRNSHSSLQIYGQKGRAFHFVSYFCNFIWACLWREYSIIYSSTGCHQNNCNECFPHGRSEMTLAVRFWIAQNLTRPTNISALTKQTSEKSCQRTLWAIALFQSSLWAIRLLYSLNINIFWFDFSSMQFELAKPLFQALELHN